MPKLGDGGGRMTEGSRGARIAAQYEVHRRSRQQVTAMMTISVDDVPDRQNSCRHPPAPEVGNRGSNIGAACRRTPNRLMTGDAAMLRNLQWRHRVRYSRSVSPELNCADNLASYANQRHDTYMVIASRQTETTASPCRI